MPFGSGSLSNDRPPPRKRGRRKNRLGTADGDGRPGHRFFTVFCFDNCVSLLLVIGRSAFFSVRHTAPERAYTFRWYNLPRACKYGIEDPADMVSFVSEKSLEVIVWALEHPVAPAEQSTAL